VTPTDEQTIRRLWLLVCDDLDFRGADVQHVTPRVPANAEMPEDFKVRVYEFRYAEVEVPGRPRRYTISCEGLVLESGDLPRLSGPA